MKDMITLTTYTGTFNVSKTWLKSQLNGCSLKDFFDSYTWDDSEWLFHQWKVHQEIEIKRKEMLQLANKEGIASQNVLKESQELDILIHQYQIQKASDLLWNN